MASCSKIRVGIVDARRVRLNGASPSPEGSSGFRDQAVYTTRQDSAEAAARHYGVTVAFCDAKKLAQHPAVDLVRVRVKVPNHHQPGDDCNRSWQASLLRMAAWP
jgi:predicted dehydrogenase